MVEAVADGLQRDPKQELHHLLFRVARGQELLYGLVFRIAAFADKFLTSVTSALSFTSGTGVLSRTAATTSAGVCRAPFAIVECAAAQ